jgi:hypothetical protein
MRLPRFRFNSLARHYFMLWRLERRETIRLRAELKEWQNRLMEKANVRPLYKPEPKPVEQPPRPPIGITGKREYLAQQRGVDNEPTAETILEAAERAKAS